VLGEATMLSGDVGDSGPHTQDLCGGEEIFFAATGVSDGNLLRGVRFTHDGATSHSMVGRGGAGRGGGGGGGRSHPRHQHRVGALVRLTSNWSVSKLVQVSDFFGKLPKCIFDFWPMVKRAKYCVQYEILLTVT